MTDRLREWARRVTCDGLALYLASRDPRVPWYAKALGGMVAAYALSPIDLIPDAIPVLGYLDDVLLLPLGILLAIRLVPPAVLAEYRAKAAETTQPMSRTAAVVIVALWGLSLVLLGLIVWRSLAR